MARRTISPGGRVRKNEIALHGSVIGEAERKSILGHLAFLGRPLEGGRFDPEAADEDVVDRGGSRRRREPVTRAKLVEHVGVVGGPQVEVAAEDEGRIAGPGRRCVGGQQHFLGRERRPVVRRVQVGDARARPGAGECHGPALGDAGAEDEVAALDDRAEGGTDEGEVGTALVGGYEVGVEAGEEGAEGAEGVARREDAMGVGVAGTCEDSGPAGRALLEEGDVPVGPGDQGGEFGQELAVDLDVGVVSLGAAEEPRAEGEEGGIGGLVAAVEEVPTEGSDPQGALSIRVLKRDFVTGEEIGAFELRSLLERAGELKEGRRRGEGGESLSRRSVGLLFERPSTRTRISFEVGVSELGGTPVVLREEELQLTRGESVGDTARVLSRYVDALVMRSGSHERLEELAREAEVPVVNGLTPLHHPCQALADLLTLRERFGDLEGLRLAYVGDGNNVARSLAILGGLADLEVVIATPEGYGLEDGHGARLTRDPRDAVAGADAIYTDVWISMGDEAEAERRRADLAPFRVDADLLAAASGRAIVLHCLPAHPGEEITAEVLYGPRSAVWDQAENRLHAQKALLEFLLSEFEAR